MDLRKNAEQAIRRWTSEFHLDQKDLAGKLAVSTSAISHIINDPEYTISDDLARRIVASVDHEACTRISALPMEIVALCHDTSFVQTDHFNAALLVGIKRGLSQSALCQEGSAGMDSVFPDHISGALVRIGGPASEFYLIALNTKNSDDHKRALAHELEHMRELILKGVNKHRPKPPRSSY